MNFRRRIIYRIRYLFYFKCIVIFLFLITNVDIPIGYDTRQKLPVNFWRPSDVYTASNNFSDRILDQLKWSLEDVKPISKKSILLIDGFSSVFYSDENFRRDCPHLADYCEFGEIQHTESDEENDGSIFRSASREFAQSIIGKNYPKMLNVLTFLESNMHSTGTLNGNEVLASYWRGSDIVTPYEKWVYHNETVKFKKQDRNYALGKTKLAAMFTSNCNTPNERLKFVKEIQKYIPVDVYGSCGPLKCSRGNNKQCFEMLNKNYKFYFAFENSNCRDYITEKFYQNGLMNNIVPVVMGAHPDDYLAVAPFKSYIHIEDFEDAESLASYLKFLDENDEEYNKYFQWKGTGEFINTKFLCRVCGMLHYADYVPHPLWNVTFDWNGSVGPNDKGDGSLPCLPSGIRRWKRDEPSRIVI